MQLVMRAAASATSSLRHARRFADFASLKPLLVQHLRYGDFVMVVGPGTSQLHNQLYDRRVPRMAKEACSTSQSLNER
jgi:hypothetical protein